MVYPPSYSATHQINSLNSQKETSKDHTWGGIVFFVCLVHFLMLWFLTFPSTVSIQKKAPQKVIVRTVKLNPQPQSLAPTSPTMPIPSPTIPQEILPIIAEPIKEPTIAEPIKEPPANEPVALEVITPPATMPSPSPKPLNPPKEDPIKTAVPPTPSLTTPKKAETPQKKEASKIDPKPSAKTNSSPKATTEASKKTTTTDKKPIVDKKSTDDKKSASTKKVAPEPVKKQTPPKGPSPEEIAAKEAEKLREQERLAAKEAARLKQQELLAKTKENMAKIGETRDKISINKAAGLTETTVPQAISHLKIDSLPSGNSFEEVNKEEASYRTDIYYRIKHALKLPEYGEVKAKLTIERSGRVVNVQILQSESAKNRQYIEKSLSSLIFPPFGSYFAQDSQHTFLITLNNDD